MSSEFKLPQLGEGVESAVVSKILIAQGDSIEADQNLMELETDKAVADLPSPYAGTIEEILISPGDTVEVGQPILKIEKAQAESTEKSQEEEEQPATEEPERSDSTQQAAQQETESESHQPQNEEPANKSEPSKGNGKTELPPAAGPATRRLARELDVDLEELQPSDGSRIRQVDVVQAYVKGQRTQTSTGKAKSLPDFGRFGTVERESLSRVDQVSLEHLTVAWRSVPQVTQFGSVDITEVEKARKQYNEQSDESSAKITMTAIAIKSVAALLREFPRFNSTLDVENNELILKQYYHVGIAVDTPHGLFIPVLREADRKSVEEIAEQLSTLADQAEHRKLQREDMEGGTFTISNQGGIGGGAFTPIVNYPEVAILGMGQASPELRMIDGEVQQRLMLPLGLSYDHRVIDGADAARFMVRLSQIFSDSVALLMET